MQSPARSLPRLALVGCALAVLAIAAAPSTAAMKKVTWFRGFQSPGTPEGLNRVGVLKFGPKSAKNILVLNPGTSAGAGYFGPLARTVVKRTKGWQVWSVERRENLLEDQSVFNQAKRGDATATDVFDYYLRWLTDKSITHHVTPVPDDAVPFARRWGMNTEIHDLRRVVRRAGRHHRRVVVGGHSLGGSIATAYATWDFHGTPGAKGLSGLVLIDGASSPTPITPDEARKSLNDLRHSSPWLSFGGIPAPLAGLFGTAGASSTKMEPDAPSIGQSWSGLPSYLKPPVPVTNEAQFGYAADTETSPDSLIAFQVHAGHLAASGDPRGWVRAGELTSIQRYATMIGGWNLKSVDGTAWYHPMRLTIDSGAVGDGNRNPAQKVLGVKAIHGDDVHVPIYAFGAALGDGRVIDAARALAKQSGLPKRELTLVDRHKTYAHNDPNSAYPRNAFLKHLLPFLAKIGGQG